MTEPTKKELRDFQATLRHRRESLGISQTRLAREIGITQPHLYYIESGRRDLTADRYRLIQAYFNEVR